MRHLQRSVKKAGLYQPLVLLAAMSLCVMSGCVTTPVVSYKFTLTEPVPGLVGHRVHEDNELELHLADDRVMRLTVASVDEEAIHGKDGSRVLIADVRQLRCLEDQETVGDALLGVAVYTVMVPVSIVLFPVALPMVLFYDWDKVGEWRDDRLCRVVAHPEFYGYSAGGEIREGEKTPPFQEVLDEFAERELQCDAFARIDYPCAATNDTGPGYETCLAEMLPREEAGFTAFYGWAEGALCRLHQDPEQHEFLAALSPEQREAIAEEVRTTLDSRDVVCPEVEQAEPAVATN